MTPAELRARVADLREGLRVEANDADRESVAYSNDGNMSNAAEAYGRWRACLNLISRIDALLSEYDASARGDKPCG